MITSSTLHDLKDVTVEPLINIMKDSYNSGTVPSQWKTASVTPIFKKGSKHDPGNYRPISLTSITGKLMESMIKDTIVDHLSRNKLIYKTQFGFMQRRSCLLNLLTYLEQLTKELDKGSSIDVVYLDYSKAFDRVPHERLRIILKAHGIRGKTLNWIMGWLKDRTQYVRLNGKSSNLESVLSGVPQGSILGRGGKLRI